MRLIDADALKAAAVMRGNDDISRKDFFQVVNNAPTIDPVKHGMWYLHEYPDGYYHTECSECGEQYSESVYWLKSANYCPNCGARMDL